jgi:ADP-ribose pyrophosphatase YjhB (NUDIX family)
MKTKDNANFFIVLVKCWIEKDGKFLIARRAASEVHAAGAWSLPGGKVEEGDTDNILQVTLAKEIKEEVGLEIEHRIHLIRNNSFTRSDGAKVVNLTFIANYKSGEAEALDQTTAIAWLSLRELKARTDLEDFMKREIEVLENHITPPWEK